MKYRTVVLKYSPRAEKMAAAVEETANAMAKEGCSLVSFSVTNSARAILVFSLPAE